MEIVSKDARLLNRLACSTWPRLRSARVCVRQTDRFARPWLLRACLTLIVLLLTLRAHGEIQMPAAAAGDVIRFGASAAQRWREGDSEVWLLDGAAFIQQGATRAQADAAVVWVRLGRYGERTGHVTAYLEQSVVVERIRGGEQPPDRLTAPSWLGTFESAAPLDIRVARVAAEPTVKPVLYRTALEHRNPATHQEIRRTQFAENVPPPANAEQPPPGTRTRLTARAARLSNRTPST